MQRLKRIADKYGITILLVHHLRKQGDRVIFAAMVIMESPLMY